MDAAYLKHELTEFIALAQRAVAHFQSGPSISTGGVVVTVVKSGDGKCLAEFHERCEQLEKVLSAGHPRGSPCEMKDKRGCPNADYSDGDETWRLDCELCGLHAGGEHPQ